MEPIEVLSTSGLSRRSRIKPFLATTVTLLLVAVAVCAVVAVFSANAAPGSAAAHSLPNDNGETLEARSLVDEPQLEDNSFVTNDDAPDSETPKIRTARFARIDGNDTQEDSNQIDSSSKTRTMINGNPSCFSDLSNKTVPAAHIKGQGLKFIQSTQESRTSQPEAPIGYQQRWKCTEIHQRSSVHAFVDGGMCFNQTDKTLGVPVCGYYMVTSQILFRMDQHALQESKTVFHLMKFKRNCGSHGTEVVVTGKSTVGPFSAENFHAGVVTTFTSDVVKLCAGGKIWVEIPDGGNGVPCCPTGDQHGTFITAVLVRESTCHWPPDTKIRYLDNN